LAAPSTKVCRRHEETPLALVGRSITPGGVRRELTVYEAPLPVGGVPARKHLKARAA